MGANTKGLEQLAEQIHNNTPDVAQTIARRVIQQMALRYLSVVIPATPVGNYENLKYKKMGGTLRNGWITETEGQAQSLASQNGGNVGLDAQMTACRALDILNDGQTYRAFIVNPVHYAIYRNYGHRTRGGGFWSDQHCYFVERSEKAVNDNLQTSLESIVRRIIEEEVSKCTK